MPLVVGERERLDVLLRFRSIPQQQGVEAGRRCAGGSVPGALRPNWGSATQNGEGDELQRRQPTGEVRTAFSAALGDAPPDAALDALGKRAKAAAPGAERGASFGLTIACPWSILSNWDTYRWPLGCCADPWTKRNRGEIVDNFGLKRVVAYKPLLR